MEDAVDDWLLREVCWLRSEDTVAQGIRWAQDVRLEFFDDLVQKSTEFSSIYDPLRDPDIMP